MKQVNLPLDVAKEMYFSKVKSLIQFAKANYTVEELEAKELPKTFKELGKISGFHHEDNDPGDKTSTIVLVPSYNMSTLYNSAQLVFKTEKQADAALALAQLSQLMAVYNDGWIPDWTKRDDKYCILLVKDETTDDICQFIRKFLAFKTAKLRNEFHKNFKDLIEQAKPLL